MIKFGGRQKPKQLLVKRRRKKSQRELFPPPSLHPENTSPIFSRQGSTQVLAVLSDAQPGAVKNNNMSKELTTAPTTENGTRLRLEKHFKISRSALEFINCQDPWAYCSGTGDTMWKKKSTHTHKGTTFMMTLLCYLCKVNCGRTSFTLTALIMPLNC